MLPPLTRRRVLKAAAAAGIVSGAGVSDFSRALMALAAQAPPDAEKAASGAGNAAAAATTEPATGGITLEMIRQAEWVAGLQLTEEQRQLMLEGIVGMQAGFAKLRARPLDNGMSPAFVLSPETGALAKPVPATLPAKVSGAPAARPASDDDLAFLDTGALGRLLRAKKVSSTELTKLYLARLRRDDPVLKCVITLTEDLALKQAAAADAELAKGKDRGPLHGIPYGLKDLIAVPGYPTTWGAGPFRDQVRPEKAAVAEKLEQAGAVLVAKTTVGELAWGDVWYGGTTKNPWLVSQGSSGSSAGSASATAAGLTGFAIGTETWGSIVSPCTVCGTSGLRPTFGRVSRYGAMALAWTMDKIGPIARSVGDLGLVFDRIHGADPRDPASVDRPFHLPGPRAPGTIRIGVVTELFDADYTKWAESDEEKPGLEEWKKLDGATVETLRRLGYQMKEIQLPSSWPVADLAHILTAEAAAAFDDLTRSGRDAQLVKQIANAWPTTFRQGQFVPAVEYIRANRIRRQVMMEMDSLFEGIDAYVVPSYGGDNLLLTNLTGHPAVVLPNGFRASDGTPTSITFQGRLHDESLLLAIAQHYQRETGFHLKRPPRPAAPKPGA
jgi:Asp-tRNA(Asn)/Glu-tRNA(Gln) amidotransferase A subunit family amidase